MIYPKIEKVKEIKESIRQALNFANVLTPPLTPLNKYELQIRKVPDEQIPNFYYTLDSNNNVEKITIIFDSKVHFYNIWYEENTTKPTVPKYKLIFQGDYDLNLSHPQTHWSSGNLEYLEAQNEEFVYSGTIQHSFEVEEVRFPKLKTFSFPNNFAPNGKFTNETFPNIEYFSGNAFQYFVGGTSSDLEFPNLKEFNGSLIPNNTAIGDVNLPQCEYFVGSLAKAKRYYIPMLGAFSGPLFNGNTQLEEVRVGVLTSDDLATKFDRVNKQTFRLYVKNGSDPSIVQGLVNKGLVVNYYG